MKKIDTMRKPITLTLTRSEVDTINTFIQDEPYLSLAAYTKYVLLKSISAKNEEREAAKNHGESHVYDPADML
ncbi:hypothetical protein KAT92_05265 [Candidatus Babeliales bacterium]|nr:hypothetical protein [Candidatus Babeliales bacterium]